MKQRFFFTLLLFFSTVFASLQAAETIPYEENFPTPASLNNWTVINSLGDGTPTWLYIAGDPRRGTLAAARILVPAGQTADAWLNSPLIFFERGKYELHFMSTSQQHHTFKVLLGTDPSNLDSFSKTLFDSGVKTVYVGYDPYKISITITQAGEYSLGFRVEENETEAAMPTTVSISSLKVTKIDQVYSGGIHPDVNSSGGISPDGFFATGSISRYSGGGIYIWEQDQESLFTDISGGSTCSATDVSNNGVVVGRFMDENYSVPGFSSSIPNNGYFKDGEWHSLGMLPQFPMADITYESGGSAEFVNSDATIIGGSMQVAPLRYRPVLWKLNDEDKYEPTLLESCEAGFGDRLFGVSEDGSIASGTSFPYQQRLPVAWINGEYKKFRYKGMHLAGTAQGVSANGKYIALAVDNRAALYDVENDELIFIGSSQVAISSYLTSVASNGTAVGYEDLSIPGSGIIISGFIYSEKLGKQFIEEIGLPTDINADGTRLTGFNPSSGTAYIYDITTDFLELGYRPQRVSIANNNPGEAFITWDAPKTEESRTVQGYNIYRDNSKVNEEVITELSYTDTGLTAKRYKYSVTAVYSELEESNLSDPLFTDVNGLRTLPFEEKFTEYANSYTLTPSARSWNTDAKVRGRWSISNNSGIAPPAFTYVAPFADFYSEDVKTAFLDGSGKDEIFLSFNIATTERKQNEDILKVEVWDGETWNFVGQFGRELPLNAFYPQKFDISEWAANTTFRVRFVATGASVVTWNLDNVRVWTPEDAYPLDAPAAIGGHRHEDGSVNIHWVQPNKEVSLSYLRNESTGRFIGKSPETPLVAAIYYPVGDLKAYEGYSLTSVSGYFFLQSQGNLVLKAVIYQGAERTYEQLVSNINNMEWTQVDLTTPYQIDTNKDLYLGFEIVSQLNGETPIFLSYEDSINERANMISEDNGATWQTTTELLGESFNRGLMIKGVLKKIGESTEADTRIYGYRVYRNGSIINDLTPYNSFWDKSAPQGEVTYSVSTFYEDQTESEQIEIVISRAGTSIEEIVKNGDLLIYPNPATDFIKIDGEFSSVDVYSLTGKMLKSTTSNILDVRNLASGIYILSIKKMDGNITQSKFIKK